jgi:hypothetical protein
MGLFYQMVPTLIGTALLGVAGFVLLLLERRDARRDGRRPRRGIKSSGDR